MTKKQAKAITLEVWRYLAKHPEINDKRDLPKKLYNKIQDCAFSCALCETCMGCMECPLNPISMFGGCRGWRKWLYGATYNDPQERKAGAEEIVRLVKAWKV